MMVFADFVSTSVMRYLRYCYLYKKAGKNTLSYWQYNFDWKVEDVDYWERVPAFFSQEKHDSYMLHKLRKQANGWLFVKWIFTFLFIFPFIISFLIALYAIAIKLCQS